jgi:hypothetical protein
MHMIAYPCVHSWLIHTQVQSISIAKLQYSGQTNENLAVLGEVETLVRPQKHTDHWRILDCSKLANCEDLSFPIQIAIFGVVN